MSPPQSRSMKPAAHLAMLLFAALIAGSFTTGALAVPYLAPLPLNAVRFILAAALMGAFAYGVARQKFAWPKAPWRFGINGALMAVYFVTMFIALTMTLPVATSALSFALMVALIVAGFTATADPLANPLPLAIWTLWWVCLAIAHAVFGNLWAALNPWTAPLALLRALGWRRSAPLLRYPERLGCWPAVVLFLAFAWFELIDIAPDNPARLAWRWLPAHTLYRSP